MKNGLLFSLLGYIISKYSAIRKTKRLAILLIADGNIKNFVKAASTLQNGFYDDDFLSEESTHPLQFNMIVKPTYMHINIWVNFGF